MANDKNKNKQPRNALGDVQHSSIYSSKEINDYIHRWQYTYVFQYYHNERQHHWPYFDLFDDLDKKLEIAKKQKDFKELNLFQFPDKHTDRDIDYHNWQLNLFARHFNEVFNIHSLQNGFHPQFKYWRLILPNTIYKSISDCITEYKLESIRDLIFEIIANAQHMYVQEIHYWEDPENEKIISSSKNEAGKVIKLIDRITGKESKDNSTKRRLELSHINFVFKVDRDSVKDDIMPIKLSHPLLAEEFINHFKTHYSEHYPYKNWRIELERYHERFESAIHKAQFKYQLAASLYNMLTTSGLFEIKKKPRPNDLMLCIARLIEFCLIPVNDFNDSDSVKTKHIRNWLDRNLDYLNSRKVPPAALIKPDKKKLLLYFDREFINCTGDVKPLDTMAIAYFLCKRFDMFHLKDDMVHIIHCLQERISQYRMYSVVPISHESEIPDLKDLLKLHGSFGRITQFKFKVADDENEYQLSEPLSMYLINRALQEAVDSHPEEYESDLVKSTVDTNLKAHSFKVNYETRLNSPEERFAPQFVKSFYSYLLNEAPPGESNFKPSNNYYMLIALAMQKSRFFNHEMDDERDIQAKVKHWHQLAMKPAK